MAINSYLSVLTLNVNELNAPIKRHRVTEWIRKQDPSICCLQVTHFRPKDTFRLKLRGWRTIEHANGQQKKADVAILISDNLGFKTNTVSRDAEGHYIIIKGSIHKEDLKIVNIYVPNVGEPKYINQLITNIKKLIDSNTIIVGDFNTPLTTMDRSSNQKINRVTMALNDTLDKMDLTDIFRTFHPKAAEYTFFSSAHGTFSRIDHILGHKSALKKDKKIEIIRCIFSDHNAMKLEINHKKKFGKVTNTWRPKNILLKNKWANQEVKE